MQATGSPTKLVIQPRNSVSWKVPERLIQASKARESDRWLRWFGDRRERTASPGHGV